MVGYLSKLFSASSASSAVYPCFTVVLLLTPIAAAPALIITAAARSLQPGEMVVLTIDTEARADTLRVRAFNRDMPSLSVGPLQWRALVGIDLNVTAGRYPVVIEALAGSTTVRATHVLVVRPRRFPTRALRVDEAYVNPPPSVTERIAREAREM